MKSIKEKMLDNGIDEKLVNKSFSLAEKYNGVNSFISLWNEESSTTKKTEIVADLKQAVEDIEYNQKADLAMEMGFPFVPVQRK